jgi:phosphoesterase RecJ-like protein
MLEKKIKIYKIFLKKISLAQKILIISHKNPDWDTLWSSTWLKWIIDNIETNKQVDIFCIDNIPDKLKFIYNTNKIKKDFSLNYDLFIFVDIASKKQTWLEENFKELFDKKSFNTISIDHHFSNELFAKQNIIISNYPSTTAIIYEIAKFLKLKFSKKIATNLLTWIITDTWNFMHSNTSPLAYKYAWELLNIWADKQYIINNFFKNNDFITLKTWGQIFSNAFIEKEILSSYITKKELYFLESNYEKVSWALDYLNTVKNIKLVSMLYQKNNIVKWSLRTLRDDINVSDLAKKYWWWWHKKAAWFAIKWEILVEKTINFEKF